MMRVGIVVLEAGLLRARRRTYTGSPASRVASRVDTGICETPPDSTAAHRRSSVTVHASQRRGGEWTWEEEEQQQEEEEQKEEEEGKGGGGHVTARETSTAYGYRDHGT